MKQILLVDDFYGKELDFIGILPADQYEVHIAEDREDGFAIASKYPIQLILVNLEKETEAADLISTLAKGEHTRTIPLMYIAPPSADLKVISKMMRLGADDFVVKPFSSDELLAAIGTRFRKIDALTEKINAAAETPFEDSRRTTEGKNHFLVKIGTRLKLIDFNRIVCITAQKEYSRIVTDSGQRIIVRRSLRAWMSFLPRSSFLRIHRATIIHIGAIDRIVQDGPRSYKVYLKGIETPFSLSQRYSNIMRKTFPVM